jgi:hypothetical protein
MCIEKDTHHRKGVEKGGDNKYCLYLLDDFKFSLWVIHKEGLCPSSGDINRLMMKYEK